MDNQTEEKKDTDASSDTPVKIAPAATPSPSSSQIQKASTPEEAEVRIVEEVVTRPAPPKEALSTPPVPLEPPTQNLPPFTQPPSPRKTVDPIILKPSTPPLEEQSGDDLAEEVGLKRDTLEVHPAPPTDFARSLPKNDSSISPITRPPQPEERTVPQQTPTPEEKPFLSTPNTATQELAGNQITKILETTKLPERRSVGATPKETPSARYDTTLAGAIDAPQKNEPVAQTTPSTTQTPEAFSIVTPLRTLKQDLQGVIRDKKMSLVRAVAFEQEKKRDPSKTAIERAPRRTSGVVFAIVMLCALGGAAFLGVAFIMGQRGGIAETPSDTSILFAEASVPLPIGNLSVFELKSILGQARTSGSATLGAITRITPTVPSGNTVENMGERPATLSEFFETIGAQTTPDLVRALSEDFFFGIHTVDENAPLFVIPVTSYERAFAGMLAWERAMSVDLAPPFELVPTTLIGSDGLPQRRQFEDLVMRNYDVRALKDDTGTVQLYYSFPSRELLIIAESPYSFTEILSRLRAVRRL